MIYFDFPNGLYIMPIVLLIFLLFWFLFRSRKQAIASFDIKTRNQFIIAHSSLKFWMNTLLLSLAWVLLTIALMQPKGELEYNGQAQLDRVDLRRKAHEVIFLLDVSLSMSLTDTRNHVSRLEAAKEIADEIIGGLKGENASLYTVTSTVTKLSPSTTDLLFVRLMLQQAQINEGGVPGTSLLTALKWMKTHYDAEPISKIKTVILFSDGGDTDLESLPKEEKRDKIEAFVASFSDSALHHLRIFTIGLGSKNGEEIPNISFQGAPVKSALDEELLKKIAEIGGGRYYLANEVSVFDIVKEITTLIEKESTSFQTQEKIQKKTKTSQFYELYYQIPLGIAIVFLSLKKIFKTC